MSSQKETKKKKEEKEKKNEEKRMDVRVCYYSRCDRISDANTFRWLLSFPLSSVCWCDRVSRFLEGFGWLHCWKYPADWPAR